MFSDTSSNENTKSRTGFLLSLVLHSIILLSLLFPIFQYKPYEEVGGMFIALGDPDAGMNSTDLEMDLNQRNTTAVSFETAKPSEVLTTANDDLIKIKTKEKSKSEADALGKAREKAEKDKVDREAREKSAFEDKKKKYSDLLGNGSGSNNKKGNQGDANGDPDGKALDGISKGSGMVGGGLKGRGVLFEPTFSDTSQKTGKVCLSICVNSVGSIAKVNFTQKGSTTSDAYLIELARKTAMKYKFSKSDVENQCGTITIDFRVQ